MLKLAPDLELTLANAVHVFGVDATELEFDWRCQVVLSLIDHLLLGCLDLLHWSLFDHQLNTRLKENSCLISLVRLTCTTLKFLCHSILVNEAMESLSFDKLTDKGRARVVLCGVFFLPVEIALKVEELIAASWCPCHPALAIVL